MPNDEPPSTPRLDIRWILILVLIVGGLMEWHYHSVAKKALPPAQADQAPSPVQVIQPALPVQVIQAPSRLQVIQIADNLDRLQKSLALFLRKHPGKTAQFADLVGPNKTIAEIDSIIGEKYPAEFPSEVEVVATMPDGTVVDWGAINPFRSRSGGPTKPMPTLEETWTPADWWVVDTPLVFQALINPGWAQHNPGQQRQLESTFIERLSEQCPPPSPAFLREVRTFLEDTANPKEQRELVFRSIAATRFAPVPLHFLMQLATMSQNPELKQAAVQCLSREEEQWAFAQVWCESNDEHLLAAVATSMAQFADSEEIIDPEDIELLLDAALATNPEDPIRTALAQQAVRKITKVEAVPALAARLAGQSAMSNGGKALASVLARLGGEDAGKAIVSWLQKSEEDATPFIETIGPCPRDPELKAAYTAALDPAVAFRNEKNREAIRTYLAPPAVLHRLKNGSFEEGTFQGFTLEGSGHVIKRWKEITPTDGQYMAFLDTMTNARDGRVTLTTEAFAVPAGMKTFLFDYYFCATALFHPVSDVLEFQILTDTETYPIDYLFANIDDKNGLHNSESTITGYELGTGYCTNGVNVESWAGTGRKIRMKFVLKGRGALPERIPGMNQDDGDPMGLSDDQGTALFLDNLRLSAGSETSVPPIDPSTVSIVSNGKTATVKINPGALPAGATVHVWTAQSGEPHTVELGTDKGAIYTEKFDSDGESSINFRLSYATANTNGDGPMFSPAIEIGVARLAGNTLSGATSLVAASSQSEPRMNANRRE
jgi:hypothetical protein